MIPPGGRLRRGGGGGGGDMRMPSTTTSACGSEDRSRSPAPPPPKPSTPRFRSTRHALQTQATLQTIPQTTCTMVIYYNFFFPPISKYFCEGGGIGTKHPTSHMYPPLGVPPWPFGVRTARMPVMMKFTFARN
jgi:hypothetical protein